MPRMKWGDNEPDWEELDDEEYDEDGGYEPYTGPVPPSNVVLAGEIKKIWSVESQSGNAMFKVLFEADGNTADKKKYNGLPIWENVVWVPQNKFRWQPWLDALGITLADVRRKTVVAEDDDNVGTPVTRIGKLQFPASIRIVTKRGSYQGEPRAEVGQWMPASDGAEEEHDDDEGTDDEDVPF